MKTTIEVVKVHQRRRVRACEMEVGDVGVVVDSCHNGITVKYCYGDILISFSNNHTWSNCKRIKNPLMVELLTPGDQVILTIQ